MACREIEMGKVIFRFHLVFFVICLLSFFGHLLFKQIVCSLEKMWSLLGIDHRHIYFWSLYCLNCKCFLCYIFIYTSHIYESFVNFFSSLMQSVVCLYLHIYIYVVCLSRKGKFSWFHFYFFFSLRSQKQMRKALFGRWW